MVDSGHIGPDISAIFDRGDLPVVVIHRARRVVLRWSDEVRGYVSSLGVCTAGWVRARLGRDVFAHSEQGELWPAA